MNINGPEDMLKLDMAEMLGAENMFLEGMREMEGKVTEDSVKQAIHAHIEQTQGQVENLKKAMKSMNVDMQEKESPVAKGLVQSYRDHASNIKDGKLLNMATLAATDKVEHFEIAAYRGLITSAEKLGMNEAVDLLRQNLQQEEATSEKVEKLYQQMM